MLLKKSSLDIPLLPEREEDKRLATLLSAKLKPVEDVVKTTERVRKRIISQSSLPTYKFNKETESKALKVLNSPSIDLGIVHKKQKTESSSQSSKTVQSLVGYYGSSTDSD